MSCTTICTDMCFHCSWVNASMRGGWVTSVQLTFKKLSNYFSKWFYHVQTLICCICIFIQFRVLARVVTIFDTLHYFVQIQIFLWYQFPSAHQTSCSISCSACLLLMNSSSISKTHHLHSRIVSPGVFQTKGFSRSSLKMLLTAFWFISFPTRNLLSSSSLFLCMS